MAILTDSVCTS